MDHGHPNIGGYGSGACIFKTCGCQKAAQSGAGTSRRLCKTLIRKTTLRFCDFSSNARDARQATATNFAVQIVLCAGRPPEALRHSTWCTDGLPILRQGQRSLYRKIRESHGTAQLAENQQMDEVVIKSYSLIDIISYALAESAGEDLAWFLHVTAGQLRRFRLPVRSPAI
jgi:hypothetical protein